ncbi:MAG: hypothetical protein KF832_14505 [Caldilineaceae bacterium]|nr:hypothetical protein [Caldilineaceae bacterium]
MAEKSVIVWWRFGKEHGEGQGFRLNPQSVIDHHLDTKVAQARQTPADQWRWWSNGKLLVERPDPTGYGYAADTRIYYLVEQGLTIIENIHLPPPRSAWTWYIHLADIAYDHQRHCWVSQDLFCDILWTADGQRYHLLDLADVGHALRLGLLTAERAARLLTRTDQLLALIAQGQFPLPAVEEARDLCRQLGW